MLIARKINFWSFEINNDFDEANLSRLGGVAQVTFFTFAKRCFRRFRLPEIEGNLIKYGRAVGPKKVFAELKPK